MDLVPKKFQDMPYAPFSKSDRLGRAADWTSYGNRYGREPGAEEAGSEFTRVGQQGYPAHEQLWSRSWRFSAVASVAGAVVASGDRFGGDSRRDFRARAVATGAVAPDAAVGGRTDAGKIAAI